MLMGRRVTELYYCGSCDKEWQVGGAQPEERRQTQRRTESQPLSSQAERRNKKRLRS